MYPRIWHHWTYLNLMRRRIRKEAIMGSSVHLKTWMRTHWLFMRWVCNLLILESVLYDTYPWLATLSGSFPWSWSQPRAARCPSSINPTPKLIVAITILIPASKSPWSHTTSSTTCSTKGPATLKRDQHTLVSVGMSHEEAQKVGDDISPL